MSERMLVISLLDIRWYRDGRALTLLGLSAEVSPDRADTSLLSLSIELPRVALHVYSDRRPILTIEYAPGCWGSPTYTMSQRHRWRW